jgi:D-glycero-D-manno-heptose 1,7-bisphosphate phosphatase
MNARPRAVLLDRDGTINVKAPEGEYITHPDQVELLPGAAQAIAALNRAGVPVVVVTNQRGIALGRMTEADLEAVGAILSGLLEREHAHIDRIFHCPHDEATCACRKPGTLLLERAREWLGLPSLSEAVMIGDSPTDVLAGRAAGVRTVLLGGDGCAVPGTAVARSLLEAVERILAEGSLPAVATE